MWLFCRWISYAFRKFEVKNVIVEVGMDLGRFSHEFSYGDRKHSVSSGPTIAYAYLTLSRV